MTSDFSERLRQYRDAIYEALASSGELGELEPLAQLGGLTRRCLTIAAVEEPASGALEALGTVASRSNIDGAVSEAAAIFESPQRFRETLYFARCLERDAGPALELLRARLYLEGAAAPAVSYPDLATDQASLLDATTFSRLWLEPASQHWMLDMIDVWRGEYAPIYTARHAEFCASVGAVAIEVAELASHARAIELLNSLARLGPPLALVALGQFHDLEHLLACPVDAEALAEALRQQPVCPLCAYRLGEDAPMADLRRVRQALERALSTELSRLSQRVVTRLLQRSSNLGEDRLDRFVQLVQVGDLSGLARVLDDGLVEFLRDLLDSPEPRLNLIDLLARDYPEVTSANAHEVVEGFRRLVEAELSREGGRFFIGRGDTGA
ncbi:MAG TPA: hypothetical protein VFY10_07085 [Dehalococcoidia bacterium]|nr:hypothetical protein [Dehalococcoidia bacterium]